MKKDISLFILIGLLLITSFILVGCGGNCDGDCVIKADWHGNRTTYKNCAGLSCRVSDHHLNNPFETGHPSGANIQCNCK